MIYISGLKNKGERFGLRVVRHVACFVSTDGEQMCVCVCGAVCVDVLYVNH
jgi:hypothetical protein